MIEAIRKFFTGLVLAGYTGCSSGGGTPPPQPPAPPHEPVCEEGATCGCWHQPPGQDWQQLPPCIPNPPPVPPATGCVLIEQPGQVGLDHPDTTSAARVNAVMARLSGCSIGSRCILTVSAWTWMAHVEQALRDEGLCASRHEVDTPGVDEISVSVDSKSVWQQYHIAAGGWDNPSPTNPLTVVWYPGAARSAYLPPGGVVPTPAPPPVGDTCPIAPCPLRLWTVETLPPGWDPAQIGKPAYEIKARLHTMGNGDSTPVVVRQEPFCAAIGLSPYADGQPRASCPVRPDGHPDRVVVENWLLFGGIVRDSRNGQDCTPHNTDNTAAFLWGTGNCRMCNVPKTACSDWY